MKSKQVKIEAVCEGIKKPERKAKRHRYTVDYLPFDLPSQVGQVDIINSIETAKTWSKNIKNPTNLHLELKAVEVDDGKDGGLPSESYLMFDKNDITIPIQ